jgi:hypothetical protein
LERRKSMDRTRHKEAEIIVVLKQVEARRKAKEVAEGTGETGLTFH